MKKLSLNSLFALTTAAALSLSLAACSSGTATTPGGASDAPSGGDGDQVYTVAVVKQMDHASLDEIADAITARLDEIAAEEGVTIQYTVSSGQNDQTTLRQIGDQAIADGVDAIIPIATTAAQVMTVCAEESQTPVIFAAISDPAAADLTGIDYVTGTSDALDTDLILEMMVAQNPDLSKVGLLYSLSEPNSATPIADAKAYLEEKGIAYEEATANTNDEVIAAASSLIASGVDAVFTPTDNVIMAAELAIYEDLIEAGIPHYTGADSFVRNGAFATCGVNYTDLGAQTADLAYEAMTAGMDGMDDFYQVTGGIITVNSETAAALGIDPAVFEGMGEVVEVTTSQE
ncbi:ABC transporter substrate-binding protein [Pseudoflavonifractor phocaeensis]|uniref:ABC transporter substrate-binding protein n=1 Tax=Pseudoflavonifractor phocaeensis TaxID=1870988 RepID=UPI00195D7BD6|nr:ABC transporter substrate-binding protein [Pseudoflavonifractor phocaeensis]MBM6870212.1 ABC transporter substrate-binding protein [Pseudoflavonifractor phocaeensis]MBM6938130.1 ABC transporter substrate-binding protein [Pseudoflavonifractor phocaeensis]